jgi:hypothetical protein
MTSVRTPSFEIPNSPLSPVGPNTKLSTSNGDLTDSQLKIFEICEKPLQTLPVSKDLPRLARKFALYVNETEINWLPVVEEDSETEGEQTVYQLLHNIHESILYKQSTASDFPSYEDFCNEVNMNDHVTINQFLLKNFGEDDAVTVLLKACHQTIVVHVLFGARAHLMKENIHFKDVRGAWKILLHFPSGNEINSRFVEADAKRITVSHKRREQVYMKTSDYLKHIVEYKKKYVVEETTDNQNPSEKKPTAFQQLFQFEWQIKIVYDINENMELKVGRVDIELLDIVYVNEDGTILDNPDWFDSVVESIEKCFTTLDHSNMIRKGFNKVSVPQKKAPILKQITLNKIANANNSPRSRASSTSDESSHSSSGSMDENCTLLNHDNKSGSTTSLLPKNNDDEGDGFTIWSLLDCWSIFMRRNRSNY